MSILLDGSSLNTGRNMLTSRCYCRKWLASDGWIGHKMLSGRLLTETGSMALSSRKRLHWTSFNAEFFQPGQRLGAVPG